jgi:glycosyltransferase involved in cell wall biosynthesis
VFCGRLSPQKGLIDLISVWKEVVRSVDRQVFLDIYGDGPEHEELQALINTQGLENSARLHGHVADIQAVLQAADIFVLPSYAEGNSNAILEAMAMGLPIVSTLVGGTEMMVGPEGRRFLLHPGDRNALQERLIELLRDGATRCRLSNAMRSRIEQHFDMPAVADSYIKAYRALLKNDLVQLGQASTDLF